MAGFSDSLDERRGSHEGVYGNEKGHNSVTVQNRTYVYMNFFDHKDLGNHLSQLCPKVVRHLVYTQYISFRLSSFENIYIKFNMNARIHAFSYTKAKEESDVVGDGSAPGV
jgi:hypothetical protein